MANTSDLSYPTGRVTVTYSGEINRGDTAARTLFTLPAGSVIIDGTIMGVAASNAGTTATVSVGVVGNLGTEFLSAFDVKTTATGLGIQKPNWKNFGATNSNTLTIGSNPIAVRGIYAETGGASNTGGPWIVSFSIFPL